MARTVGGTRFPSRAPPLSTRDCARYGSGGPSPPPPGMERLVLLEFVAGNGDDPSKLINMTMLVLTDGGRVRTEVEHGRLLASTGFELVRRLQAALPALEAAPAA
jgi:hypothetical protein